jgi:uncharacterized protein YkwD
MRLRVVRRREKGVLISVLTSMLLVSCSPDEEPVIIKQNLRVELLQAVNELRADGCQCGADWMPPVTMLRWNDTLQLAAENHANDMYSKGYFSHLSPDGAPPIVRAMQVGYEGEYVGENIARGYTTINEVMTGWKESESHCKAMMDTLYNEMGASEVAHYWVLDLGRAK